DGSFATRAVPIAEYGFVDVNVSAAGYCGVRFYFKGADESGLTVPLVHGATIEGVVRDEKGNAVPEAVVWLGVAEEEYIREVRDQFAQDSRFATLPQDWRLTAHDIHTTANDIGRFKLDGALPWQSKVQVWADKGKETRARSTEIATMPAPGESA